MNRVIKIFLFSLFFIIAAGNSLLADIIGTPSPAGYAWADSQDVEFGWIEISDGTVIGNVGDDNVVYTVNLPFTFEFYSKPFTTMYVSTNGFITFEDYAGNSFPSNDALPPGGIPDSLIAVFWDNLVLNGPANGQIYSKTIGTAPYRKHIIEWSNAQLNSSSGTLTFQVILYETTNLIKFQYLDLGTLLNDEIGRNATEGIRANPDVVEYGTNDPILSEGLAVLFFPLSNLSGTAAITPTSADAGTNAQPFRLEVNSLEATASFTDNGKADVLRIANPFPSPISIIDTISVDGNDFFFIQRNSAPTVAEYNFFPNIATWFYDNTVDSLYIRLPPLSIRDNISVSFRANVPTTTGATAVNYDVYTYLNEAGRASLNTSFTVNSSSTVQSYSITPTTPTNILAGQAFNLTVTALDEFDNPVNNNESVTFRALGSSTATFSQDTVAFGGANNITRSVTETVVGDFNVRVLDITNANKDAVTATITVLPAAPSALEIVSSVDTLVAGATRRLQVLLTDAFGNVHRDSTVSFQILTGDAQFTSGGTNTTDITDANGIAEVDYRASTSTAVGNDQIQVSIGGVSNTITIPLKSGEISYFDLSVIGASTVTANTAMNVQVIARDVFGNGVVSSESYTMSAIGSATAVFSPSDNYTFSADSVDIISVSDVTAGTFTVRASLDSDNSRTGTSPLLTVTPATIAELRIRSQAGNTGNDLGGVNINITSTETLFLYAAGYDAFGNYTGEVANAEWTVASGTLNPSPPLTFPFIGESISFSPASSSSGVLRASIPSNPGVLPDVTGTITVSAGELSFIKIQTDSSDIGTEVGDLAGLSVGSSLTLYAVGYDSDNNRIGNTASNWSVSPTTLGEFANGQPTQNGVSSVVFTATGTGNGIVRAEAVSNSAVFDQTGVLTVGAGAAASIRIRSAANNGGFAYDVTPLTIDTDTTISLFAASYDAFGNYTGDVSVSWAGIGLTGVPAGPATSINFSPTVLETGRIRTSSALVDDTTAFITVQAGAIAQIRVQDGATGTASEIDTTTLNAGSALTAFAGGYDADGNFVSLVSSNWAVEGNAIGVLSTSGPATSTIFTAQTVGNGRIRATQNGGSLTDLTSTIRVNAGAPATLTKIAASDSQAAPINSELPRDIEVLVNDAFGNPVPSAGITFNPLAGGTVNPTLAITDNAGIASTRWTVHGTVSTDSLSAQFTGGVTVPDSVVFYALVSAGNASTLSSVGSTTGSGTVGTTLGNAFTVQVQDGGGNPVANVPVSFAITSQPTGAVGATLSTFSVVTNTSGQASTTLTLGSRLGNYIVQASTATTTPTFINFTGTANQTAAADSIFIVSGNNQTGTVGQSLGNAIVFQVNDAFGNAVSGANVTFATSDGGVITPPSGTTNASGRVSTSWQLGSGVGTQQFVATLTSNPLRTATVNANASAGAATNLALVSMRQIPGDSVVAVAGENISVIIEARDAFGNPAPGTTIDFSSVAGFNVGFENPQLVTGADGRVSNIVKTDINNTASYFNAVISGVTTLELHVFHLRYVNNSLTPASVSPDSTVSFQLSIANFAPAAAVNADVLLDAGATLFVFEDGTNTYSAALTAPVTLTAASNTALTFTATQIDPNFANASYAPIVTLKGAGTYDVLAGQVVLPSNSLRIFSSQISAITAANTVYSRGDVFQAFMTVNNDGPDTVNVNTATLTISGFPQSAITALPGNPVQLLPNTPNNQFGFEVSVPGNATPGNYTIDGQFSGTTTSGTIISDGSANNPWNFAVVQNADLSVLNVAPTVVTTGETFTFTAELLNLGGLTTVLDETSTFLVFDNDSAALAQSSSIPPGTGPQDAVTLTFDPRTVTAAASATPYPILLVLSGTENGAPFDTTIAVASNTMLVQNAPDVQVSFFSVAPDSVTQGTDALTAKVILTNSGVLNASATLARPDSIRLSTVNGALSGILPISADNALFPLNLSAGTSSDTIDFVIPISESYPTGLETARVSYGFSDDNSGSGRTIDPSATTAAFTILSLPEVVLVNGSNSLTPQTVTRGLQNVDYRFSLRNDGEGDALIGAGDIALSFNNNHTATLTAPTIPQVLEEGEIEEFVFSIDIDPNSSIGNDPIDVTTRFTDVISGESYTLTYDGLDTLQIITGADPTLLQIQFVQINPTNAVQGQTGIGANVQLRNLSQSPVLVNTLNLVPDRTGINAVLNTPLGTIAGGATALYNFTLSVDAGMTPGPVEIDAGYTATDQTSGGALSDSGAVVPDSLNILTPAAFSFGAISVTPSSVGEGQTGIAVQTTLTNTGQSTVSVTTLDLSYNVGGTNISDVLVIPSLPIQLPGGETVAVEFTLDIANPSSYIGPVQVSASAAGLDLTNSTAVNGTSLTPGNFTIVQQANLTIAEITAVPDSAALGQDDVAITVRATNIGEGNARLNASTLRLANANFSTALQTTGFPFTLAQGDTQDIVYLLDVPENIILNNADSTIFLGARLEGSDINTGASLEALQDSIETLVISAPPEVVFDALQSPQFYSTGESARIIADIRNDGGSRLLLNANTILRLQDTQNANQNISIPIDLAASDITLNPGETVRIESQDSTLTIPGTFRLFVDINGTAFGADFTQEVNSSTNINVGGDIFVSQLTASPNEVAPGATGIEIAIQIQNNTLPATVESSTLTLNYADNNEPLLVTTTLIDSVDIIPQTPDVALFRWSFDLPIVRTGPVRASVSFSLNGGAEQLNYSDPGTSFNIISGIDIAYVDGSLVPDSVVNGEFISFSARFSNSGNTTLLVDPTISSISFNDGGTTYQALVDGNFTIRGTQDATPDTSTLNFSNVQLDEDFNSGLYDISFSMQGSLPNGDTFEGFDTTTTDPALTVLPDAEVIVDGIDILPTDINRGQTGVQIAYTLRNNGGSAASVSALNGLFADSSDNDITFSFQTTAISPVLPVVIAPGGTATITRDFTVLSSVPLGEVTAYVSGTFNDVRKPLQPGSYEDLTTGDVVNVTTKAGLNFSGVLGSPDGALDGTVSTFQKFAWSLTVNRVPGTGDLVPNDPTRIALNFANRGFFFDSLLTVTSDTVSMIPDQTTDVEIWAGSAPRLATLRAVVIDTSRDASSGEPAVLNTQTIAQSMLIQERADLKLDILAPTLVDPSNFTMTAVVENIGTAGIVPNEVTVVLDTTRLNGIRLDTTPETFTVPLNQNNGMRGEVQLNFIGLFESMNDSLLASILTDTAVDTNSTQTAFKSVPNDTAVVSVITQSAAVSNERISSPVGATDGIVSTSQEFLVKADYFFNPTVIDTNTIQSRIKVPAGYNGGNDTLFTPLPSSNDSIEWSVIAPAVSTPEQNLEVEFTGRRLSGPDIITITRQIPVTTVRRAELSVIGSILEPDGAKDGVVSTQQFFDVRIEIPDSGEAGTVSGVDNRVRTVLPAGYFFAEQRTDTTLSIATDGADTLRVRAPATPTTSSGQITFTLEEAAPDANTGLPAEVIDQTDRVGVLTVERASLAISFDTNTQFSQNQTDIPVRILVNNTGAALTEPDSVEIHFALDSLLTIVGGINQGREISRFVKLVNNVGQTDFVVNALADTGTVNFTATIIDTDVQDQNNNYPDTLVNISTGEVVLPVTVGSGASVAVAQAAISEPNGAIDNIISTGQRFVLDVEGRYTGNVAPEDRIAELLLPPGAGFLADTLVKTFRTDTTVFWEIFAPQVLQKETKKSSSSEEAVKESAAKKATNFILKIAVRGEDGNNPGSIIRDTLEYPLDVLERANLVLSSTIVSGVTNNTVSFGQQFVYEATVSNTGEALLSTTPQGQIRLELGDSLQVVQGDVQQPFTINVPVSWTIQADTSTLVSKLTRDVHDKRRMHAELLQRLQAVQQVEEGNTFSSDKLELQQLESDIAGLHETISKVVSQSFVKVVIDPVPFDENTNAPAFQSVGSDSIAITIDARPEISIVSITTPSTVSTNQSFNVDVVVEAPDNVINRQAVLLLPEGYQYATPGDSVRDFSGTTTRWPVRAPQTLPVGSESATLTVLVRGEDRNNATVDVEDTSTASLTTEKRAVLDLRSTASQNLLRITQQQEFVINAVIKNLGFADVSGTGSVQLRVNSPEFTLINGSTAVQDFTIDNSIDSAFVTWQLAAPADTNINTEIGIGFMSLPVDNNTSGTVDLQNDSLTFFVNMVAGQVFVEKFEVERENNFFQGESNIPAFGLEFTNPGRNETTQIRNFTLSIRDGANNEAVVDPQTLVSRVRVVSEDFYLNTIAGNKTPAQDIFGELQITEATGNPFTVAFDPSAAVVDNLPTRLVVLLDLASGAPSRKFAVRLDGVRAEQEIGAFISGVEVIDKTLDAPLDRVPLEFQSNFITVINEERETLFRNYPNPFGQNTSFATGNSDQGQTRFNFWMDEAGSAELRIYTLIGRLVIAFDEVNLPRGMSDGDLSWNGLNGKGQRVTNGVYAAVLRIRLDNGQTKELKTKVVYIK